MHVEVFFVLALGIGIPEVASKRVKLRLTLLGQQRVQITQKRSNLELQYKLEQTTCYSPLLETEN